MMAAEIDPAVCQRDHHIGKKCADLPIGWHECDQHFHLEPDGHCTCRIKKDKQEGCGK